MVKCKTCTGCDVGFPNTEKHFYKKRGKYKVKSGEERIYYKLTAICRNCHGKQGYASRRKKRILSIGCTEENYKETYLKQMRYSKLKYKELNGIPTYLRGLIVKAINKGYKFTTIEDFKEYRRLKTKESNRKTGLTKRKYTYRHKGKLSPQEINKMHNDKLTDSRIALGLGMSVSEVPKNLIEAKRDLIKLKRYLGMSQNARKKISK